MNPHIPAFLQKNLASAKPWLSAIWKFLENPNKKGGCEISVDYSDEPINCSESIDEVLRLLEIN